MSDQVNNRADSFSSNAVRLSMVEWFAVLVIVASIAMVLVQVWERVEPFEPSPGYRIPYDSSEDYWLFERYCEELRMQEKTILIGDSFVWGQYVGREGSLSHFLNQEAGSDRFANAGLDGTHPLALEGLIRHHCKGLKDREVILHLNLLWASSPEADLRSERNTRVNHPRLLPQFDPAVRSYSASVSDRLGVVLARYVKAMDWSRHLQATYFENGDLHHWSVENPYRNPLAQFGGRLPEADVLPHRDPRPWFAGGGRSQELPWVPLDISLQWQAFKRLVALLKERGNTVFVMVGPLNEHMLTPASRGPYREALLEVGAWLEDRELSYFIPPVLPSELYADLSHPLSEGYATLAEQAWRHFQTD